MRSPDAAQPSLFSYSQTTILCPPIIRCAGSDRWSMRPGLDGRQADRELFAHRPTGHRPGTPDPGVAASVPILDPFRASARRAAALPPALSLVCRAVIGRCGLGRHDVHQEPSALYRWHGDRPTAGSGGLSSPPAPGVDRTAFLCGRHLDQCLGLDGRLCS